MTQTEIERLVAENETLRTKLQEAEETIQAIQKGAVDGLFVSSMVDGQLFTRKGADQPYRMLIEEMGEGAMMLTEDGMVLYANRRLAALLKVPLEELIGSYVDRWISLDGRSFTQVILHQLYRMPEKKWQQDLQLQNRNGAEVPVHLSVNKLQLDGEPVAFSTILTDLTDQKRHEAILASQMLAQTILNQAAEAIVVCDATGQIIRANDRAASLCQQNPIGHMFQHIFDLQAAGDSPFSLATPTLVGQKRVEARLPREGKALDLLVSISPLHNEQKERLGTVITLTDITERKQAEKNILDAQAELTRLLAEADQSRLALLSLVEDQQQAETALHERLKEMACLYAIRRDMSLNLTTEQLCDRIVEHLSKAMQHPEITAVCLCLDDKTFTSAQYAPTLTHSLEAEIVVNEENRGMLCVYYTEEKPFLLPEEQDLLNAIVEALQLWLARQQAETARRKSERLLNETQALAKTGGWEYDATTHTLSWTNEVHRILNIPDDIDLTNIETALSFYEEEDKQRLEQGVLTAIATQQTFEIELPFIDGDGRNKWVYINCEPVFESEQLSKMVGYIMDITERKQHEQEQEAIVIVSGALRKAENRSQMLPLILEQLRYLLQTDGAALAIYHPETETAVIEEAQGKMSQGLGLHHSMQNSITGKTLTTGQPFITKNIQSESELLYKNLFNIDQAAACIPLITQQQPIGAIWVCRPNEFTPVDLRLLTTIADITANAIHRATLYEQTVTQAEQINQIVNSVPDGVLLLNENHKLLMANSAAQTYLELLADIHIGDTLNHLNGRPLEELLATPPPGSWHTLTSQGKTFEAIASPLSAGPTDAGWVMVLRDVTERQMVQQQLQQQERLAAVGQLAAGIAHDFNNLMAVIILYSQLLAKSPGLTARDHERLDTIIKQTEHAARMIQQILDFSRRAVLERQTLNLYTLLKEQTNLLRRTLPEHIEIVFQAKEKEYLVQADPTRLQQAVINLAFNARDAMPKGGQLTFTLKKLSAKESSQLPSSIQQNEDWIELTISDTGTGIAEKHLPHLFEPFFTTKSPDKGTGLGLAQVHGIVSQHGGHIFATSQPNTGATFTIYLPALAAKPATTEADDSIFLPPGEGEMILVVEDNKMLRLALTDYLQMWGYLTLEAANGEEALEIVQAQGEQIALILSDVVMPRLGGIDLFRRLRQQEYDLPVILLTGHPLEEEMVVELRSEGLQAWLPKPPNLSQLAQLIVSVLTKSKAL